MISMDVCQNVNMQLFVHVQTIDDYMATKYTLMTLYLLYDLDGCVPIDIQKLIVIYMYSLFYFS